MRRLHLASTVLVSLFALSCMGSRTRGDVIQHETADFSGAVLAEVKNAQGQVILSGRFVEETDGTDVERKASLAPTGVDSDATGDAEVEVSGTGSERTQEIEFSISNVEPRAVFTFVIDGKVFATASADDQGRVAFEREVPLRAGAQPPGNGSGE